MSEELGALPESWEPVKLEDICWKITDGTHKTPKYVDEGVRFISIKNIKPFSPVNWDSYVKFISREEHESLIQRCDPEFDDILFPRIGTLGYAKRIDFTEEVSLFVGLGLAKPIKTAVTPKYLEYWMNHPLIHQLSHDRANGTGRLTLPLAESKLLPVPLAPYSEQIRIVEKLEELLSDLDNGVAELQAAQKKLNQYRQSLLKSAVEGTLTKQWRKDNADNVSESGEQLLARILKERRARWEAEKQAEFKAKGKTPLKNWQQKYQEPVAPDTSELPELPEGWVWASLDMLGDIVSGVTKGTKRKTPQETREVPYLRVANVQRGFLNLDEIKTIEATESDIQKYTLKKNDILFNEGGDRDKLGRGWVWYGEVDGCIHQNHVFRLRLFIEKMVPELISHYGNTFGKVWFQNAGKQTTNLASINKGILQAFPVPLAPISEQKEIYQQLQNELEQLAAQEVSTNNGLKLSESQRKNILKDAFSGKLVSQDPAEQPASELLKKIQQERAELAKQPNPKRPKKKAVKIVTMETLEEVLQKKDDWIDAQEAFKACGVSDGTDTDRIETLYAELRKLDKAGRLDVERRGDYDMIKLKGE